MSEEKKIIVDEDWKSQVQAEKESLKEEATSHSPAGEPAPEKGEADPHEYALPPASFPFLLTTLATQAFVSLGQIANPLTGKAEHHPEQARHFIDTLAMLQEKTTGNLTSEEAIMLDQLLHELRMIAVTGQTSEQRARDAAQNPPV